MATDAPEERVRPNAQLRMGQRLRDIRLARGVSGRALAERCGVSPSFISQVESGQVSPSIASLERITRALGVGISDLFEPGPLVSSYVTRAGQRTRLSSTWSRASIEAVIAPGEASQLDSVLITLGRGGANASKAQTAATEHLLFVLSGRMTLQVDGETHVLAAGDAAFVPAGGQFRLTNEGVAPGEVLLTAPRSVAGPGLFRARLP